ncbi:hypothetical protein N7527_010243 [Penicillium freii]|nr:hypothetical protein N7527_010243 [Penicillium freii]
MRGDDLPDTVTNTQEIETSQLSCKPYITAPISTPEPIPEQANYISSNLSMRKLSTIEPSDISDSRDYENDLEPSQISNLGENPYLRANKASERAKDPSTIEDTPAIS